MHKLVNPSNMDKWTLGRRLLLLLLLSHFSRVQLCATPETAAHQAPRSLEFSRQEHWSGLPFPSPMHESEKWKWSRSVVSDSSRLHGLQPTRLLCPWDFPGKSTGVGCHCLLRNASIRGAKMQEVLLTKKKIFFPFQRSPPRPHYLLVTAPDWHSRAPCPTWLFFLFFCNTCDFLFISYFIFKYF